MFIEVKVTDLFVLFSTTLFLFSLCMKILSDWTLFSSAHNDPMASDVIAPSPWSIFGCKNGNDKIFSLSSDEISTKIHFYMHLGLRLFTEANDGGSRGKVFLILCNVLCVRADGLLNSQYLACLLSIGMIIRL
jgi:hypothetical protein